MYSLDLFGGYQHRGAFVFHEEHDEFRRFGLASVSPDDVKILRAFIEGLTRCQSHFFPAPDLHYDRAFQHINKPMCVVAMYWVRAARRILNQEHQTFLPGRLVSSFDMSSVNFASLGSVVAAIPERTPTVATSAQTISVRRNSPTDSGVWIRFIARFLSLIWLVGPEMFGRVVIDAEQIGPTLVEHPGCNDEPAERVTWAARWCFP